MTDRSPAAVPDHDQRMVSEQRRERSDVGWCQPFGLVLEVAVGVILDRAVQVDDLRIDRVTGDELRLVGVLDRQDRGRVDVATACLVNQVVEVGRQDRADPALANQLG